MNINHLKRNVMKRNLLLLLLAAISAISVNAADDNDEYIFRNPSGYWGIRASYNLTVPGEYTFSKTKKESVFKPGSGFEAGVTRLIPLVSGFYLEPGAMLFLDTYSVKSDKVYLFQNGTSISTNKFGMRIPVMAGWQFKFGDKVKLNLFTGPEFEIGFTGNTTYGYYNGEETKFDIYSPHTPNRIRNIAVLWEVGTGVSFKKYYLGVSGHFGLTDMSNNNPEKKFRENHIMVTLGLNLNTYNKKKRSKSAEINQ